MNEPRSYFESIKARSVEPQPDIAPSETHPEIPGQLRRLEDRLSNLFSLADGLQERLNPVLSPPLPNGIVGTPIAGPSISAPIALVLGSYVGRLDEVIDRLVDTMKRLEV